MHWITNPFISIMDGFDKSNKVEGYHIRIGIEKWDRMRILMTITFNRLHQQHFTMGLCLLKGNIALNTQILQRFVLLLKSKSTFARTKLGLGL